MRRKRIALFGAILVAIVPAAYVLHVALGASAAQSSQQEQAVDQGLDRYIDNVAFGIGEKLQYDLDYGFINAGYATMEVQEMVEYNNRPCYLISSTANSNKFFSSFYRVEDKVETVVDAVGLYSWHFEKHLKEGTYSAERSYSFDQLNHKAIDGKDTIDIAPYVQDALSVLYYARTIDLKVGQSVYIDNFTDGKKYPLEVRVRRRESVKIKAGKFDCIVVEPLLLTSGIFKHEGQLTVWLTNDRLKLPVLMKSRVIVGSITAELTSYKLGKIMDF